MAIVRISLTGESRRAIQRSRIRGTLLKERLPDGVQKAGTALAHAISEREFGEGKTVGVITGMLRAAIACRTISEGNAVSAMIGVTKGPATKYAAVQEGRPDGSDWVIKARPGKALAVPLDAAKTGTGRPKYPLGPRDPRVKQDYPGGTFLYVSENRGKAPVIMGLKVVPGGGSRKTRPVPLFALVKSVRIPQKRYLRGGTRRHIGVFEFVLGEFLDSLLAA